MRRNTHVHTQRRRGERVYAEPTSSPGEEKERERETTHTYAEIRTEENGFSVYLDLLVHIILSVCAVCKMHRFSPKIEYLSYRVSRGAREGEGAAFSHAQPAGRSSSSVLRSNRQRAICARFGLASSRRRLSKTRAFSSRSLLLRARPTRTAARARGILSRRPLSFGSQSATCLASGGFSSRGVRFFHVSCRVNSTTKAATGRPASRGRPRKKREYLIRRESPSE